MAINLNDNIRVLAPKPTDARYLNNMTPYTDETQVYNSIPIAQRYRGLTVNIGGREYWFKDNINTLVIKDPSDLDISGIITGVTNLGYFYRVFNTQKIKIIIPTQPSWGVNYISTIDPYYIDEGGVVRMGTIPWNGVSRRAYIREDNGKTFIWNLNTDSGRVVGWIFIDGSVVDGGVGWQPLESEYYQYYTDENDVMVGEDVVGDEFEYIPFKEDVGLYQKNNIIIQSNDSIISVDPLKLGSPIYGGIQNGIIGLRSLHKKDDFIEVENDLDKIYLGVNLPVTGSTNIGVSGIPIVKRINDKNIEVRKLVAGDNIKIELGGQNNNEIYISSDVSGTTTGGTTSNENKQYFTIDDNDIEEVLLDFSNNLNSIGVKATYSMKTLDGSRFSMGEVFFTRNIEFDDNGTTKDDDKIFVSSMFDDIDGVVFIKRIDSGEVVFEIKNESGEEIKINLLINYI